MNHTRIFLFAILLAGLLASCKSSTSVNSTTSTYHIVPPSATTPHGHSWDTLMEAATKAFILYWAQCDFSCSTPAMPLVMQGNADIGLNQNDNVWFASAVHAGASTADTTVDITIPGNAALYMPVAGDFFSDAGDVSQAQISSDQDSIAHGYPTLRSIGIDTVLEADIDGQSISNLTSYYIYTHPFEAYFPAVDKQDSSILLGPQAQAHPSQPLIYDVCAGGIALLFDQFSAGDHLYHMRQTGKLQTNITWHIHVQ